MRVGSFLDPSSPKKTSGRILRQPFPCWTFWRDRAVKNLIRSPFLCLFMKMAIQTICQIYIRAMNYSFVMSIIVP